MRFLKHFRLYFGGKLRREVVAANATEALEQLAIEPSKIQLRHAGQTRLSFHYQDKLYVLEDAGYCSYASPRQK